MLGALLFPHHFTPLCPSSLLPARQGRGSGMRLSADDSWRDTAALVLMGIPPNHTGCTGRVEEQGERKFLVLLPALTNTLQEWGSVWPSANRFLGDERCCKSETANTQNLLLFFSPSLDPLWIWLVGSVLLLCQDSESKQQWISHCYCSSPNSKQLSEEWGPSWKTNRAFPPLALAVAGAAAAAPVLL